MTIQQAATQSGWSPRMLRYVEGLGLSSPQRSRSGYRLYSETHVERLTALRLLMERHGFDLRAAGFALRLSNDQVLRTAIDDWITGAERERESSSITWLRFEQDKHQRLLAGAVAVVALTDHHYPSSKEIA